MAEPILQVYLLLPTHLQWRQQGEHRQHIPILQPEDFSPLSLGVRWKSQHTNTHTHTQTFGKGELCAETRQEEKQQTQAFAKQSTRAIKQNALNRGNQEMLMDLGRCSPNPDSSPHADMTAPPKQPPAEVCTLRCLPGLEASWVLMQLTVPEPEVTSTTLPPRCSCISCTRKRGLPCQPVLRQEAELSVQSVAEKMGEKGPLAAGCIRADTRAPLCA